MNDENIGYLFLQNLLPILKIGLTHIAKKWFMQYIFASTLIVNTFFFFLLRIFT